MLVSGFGAVAAGDLEPSAPPGPTMKSLDEIAPTWSQTLDSTNGEPDGCNSDRFKCVLNDEAVLDMETGLIWQRSPENAIIEPWLDHFENCWARTTGNRGGWRMATLEEFLSLVDFSPGTNQALPASHPFTEILEMTCYFTATSRVSDLTRAWGFGCAGVNGSSGCGRCDLGKLASERVWCVRGGSLYVNQTEEGPAKK
jgi:hypothetical protein